MKRLVGGCLGLALLVLPLGRLSIAEEIPSISRIIETGKTDFRNYYLDRTNLARLGIGLAGGAVFANTGMDRDIRNRYQSDMRSKGTDDAAKIFKVPGSALVAIPIYAGSYGTGMLLRNPTIEEWAEQSFRATVVGAPALLFFQDAIGSDRPVDGNSHWRPFHGSHGVSGHAFIGGVSFIAAAKMSENPYMKGIFYGLSTLTGFSRINDDAHYFSQAAMGWYLAYLSCTAVKKGEDRREGQVHVGFAIVSKGIAITAWNNF